MRSEKLQSSLDVIAKVTESYQEKCGWLTDEINVVSGLVRNLPVDGTVDVWIGK